MRVNAFWLMLGALGTYAIFYRYYGGFLSRRVLGLSDARVTPAHEFRDGQNFHPTNPWVLWGHHFAAISGAGPLIGPVLAAQFGYLPGFLWLVFGVCIAGSVQDFVILVGSIRRGGRSLAEIAREEITPRSGLIAIVAVLFIVVVALAVLGFVVVNALAESAWGTFTIAASIPIAIFMGVYLYRLRPGRVREASAIGVTLLVLAVIAGAWLQPNGPWAELGSWFTLSRHGLTTALAVYGFAASVLPVWLLLLPRDYLSSYMKVGTIALIVGSVLLVHPVLKMPALTQFIHGGGPIVAGPLFPFVFITIACGAISGFHALVSSGTTSKLIDKEGQARFIGYGAMLMESLVGVTALVAACSMFPTDYYQINLRPEAFAALSAKMHLAPGHLEELARLVGEPHLEGRTGGAVSLAAGITQIFENVTWLRGALSYFYHFMIMFEALFILTTIDAGTRIGRFLVQEFAGRFSPKLGRTDWIPGTVAASVLVVSGWSYFIYTGNILTLWPMFGVANQLLSVVALVVATTILVNEGKSRYAWVTLVPLAFVGSTTLSGGFLSITDIFVPMLRDPAQAFKGGLNIALTVTMMACVLVILAEALPVWRRNWKSGSRETIARVALPGAAEAA